MSEANKTQEKIRRPDELPSRRAVTQGIGASIISIGAGAGIAIPIKISRDAEEIRKLIEAEDRVTAAAFGKEWLEKRHQETTAFIRSPDGKRILENGTDEEIEYLLLSLSGVLQEEVAHSAMDPVRLFSSFPVLQAGGDVRSIENTILPEKHFGIPFWSLANGSRVGKNLLFSCAHVIGSQGTIYSGVKSSIDASVVQINKDRDLAELSRAPILQFTAKSADDLLGIRVTVIGIDQDPQSLPDGSKRFTSLMIPVTKHLIEFLKRNGKLDPSRYQLNALEKSYLILLHSGTWVYTKGNAHIREMYNMSGSPALLDDGRIAGILHAVTAMTFNGSIFGFGLLHITPQILGDMSDDAKSQLAIAE